MNEKTLAMKEKKISAHSFNLITLSCHRFMSSALVFHAVLHHLVVLTADYLLAQSFEKSSVMRG